MITKIKLQSILVVVLLVVWQCKGMEGILHKSNAPANDLNLSDDEVALVHQLRAVGDTEEHKLITKNTVLAVTKNFDFLLSKDFSVAALPTNALEIPCFSEMGGILRNKDEEKSRSFFLEYYKDTSGKWHAREKKQSNVFYTGFMHVKNGISPHMTLGRIFLLTLFLRLSPIQRYYRIDHWIDSSWVAMFFSFFFLAAQNVASGKKAEEFWLRIL